MSGRFSATGCPAEKARLALAVPNLGPHASFLAADLAPALSSAFRSHKVLQTGSEIQEKPTPPTAGAVLRNLLQRAQHNRIAQTALPRQGVPPRKGCSAAACGVPVRATRSGVTSMWSCPKCGEAIDAPLDACWQCGTSRHGVETPAFVRADDDVPAALPDRRLGPRRSGIVCRSAAILAVLAAASVGAWFGWPPRLGTELGGGTVLVYEIETLPGHEKPAREDMQWLALRVRARLRGGAMWDGEVRPLGEDRLEITVPQYQSVEEVEAELDRAIQDWGIERSVETSPPQSEPPPEGLRFRLVGDTKGCSVAFAREEDARIQRSPVAAPVLAPLRLRLKGRLLAQGTGRG